jgi:hypothetical protein
MKATGSFVGSGAGKVGRGLVWAGKGVGKGVAAPFKLTAAGAKNLGKLALYVAKHPILSLGNVIAAPVRVVSWGTNKLAVTIGRRVYEVSQLAGRAFVAVPGIPYTAAIGVSDGVKGAIKSSKLRMMDTKKHWQEKRLEVAATDGGNTIEDINVETNREIAKLNLGADKRRGRVGQARHEWDSQFGGPSTHVANTNVEDDNEDSKAA